VAEPGSVLISQTVFDQVKRAAQLTFENLGPRELKHISEPMTLYKVRGDLDCPQLYSGRASVGVYRRGAQPQSDPSALRRSPTILNLAETLSRNTFQMAFLKT
jgi:hypothetical protein